MFWIFFLLSFLAGGLLYSAWKFGLFQKFQMQKGKLMACEILYLPYKGDYTKIGPLFEQVSQTTKSIFTFSQNFGFYYDDPSHTAPQNCRAIVGILVNQGEQFKIKQFLIRHKQYKIAHLKTTRYISYEMPFVNILSILLMIKKIYPKIQQHIKKEEINEEEMVGIMELYKCIRADKKIQIIVPLHNKEQFLELLGDYIAGEEENQKNNKIIKQSQENHIDEKKSYNMMRKE